MSDPKETQMATCGVYEHTQVSAWPLGCFSTNDSSEPSNPVLYPKALQPKGFPVLPPVSDSYITLPRQPCSLLVLLTLFVLSSLGPLSCPSLFLCHPPPPLLSWPSSVHWSCLVCYFLSLLWTVPVFWLYSLISKIKTFSATLRVAMSSVFTQDGSLKSLPKNQNSLQGSVVLLLALFPPRLISAASFLRSFEVSCYLAFWKRINPPTLSTQHGCQRSEWKLAFNNCWGTPTQQLFQSKYRNSRVGYLNCLHN